MMRFNWFVAAISLTWVLPFAPLALAQDSEDADALNAKVVKLLGEGKYADGVLAPKTEAVDLATAERAPETPFGVAHGLAQSLSAFD